MTLAYSLAHREEEKKETVAVVLIIVLEANKLM